MRYRLLIPTAVLLVLAALYYWAWQNSAATVRAEITDWIAEEQAAGRTAEYERFRISGFPYRMQIDIRGAHLADPEAGLSWQADRITGFVLPYRLNHAVLVFEGQQRVAFNRLGRREVLTGAGEDQRASIVLRDGELDRFALEANGVALLREIFPLGAGDAPERTESLTIQTAQVHTRRVRDNDDLPAEGHHHAAMIEAHDITWNGHPYEGLGSDIAFVLARVLVAGMPESSFATFDPDTLRLWHDNDGILYLDEAAIRWSEIEVAGTGVFQLDSARRPEGEMTILVSGHSQAIDALVAGGALDPQYADISKTVLDVIAAIGGDPEGRIRAPLRFEEGTVYLGPAEMMDLPPLY